MNFPLVIFFLTFIVCFLIKMPIGIGMMVSSIFYFALAPGLAATMDVVANQFCSQLFIQYIMIAVPMFVFSANIMNSGKITNMIFKWAGTLVGRWQGGLGHVNILASLIFSGMTGAATADAAGLGTMEIAAMRESGYDDGFSCAITCASSTIGPIFPPSIPMVLYATTAGVSVGSLFMGGIIPGVLLALALMIYVMFIARKRNYPSEKIDMSIKAWLWLTLKSLPSLITPIILLLGIYTGLVTPTEAGALAGLWAICVSFLIYRSLSFKDLWELIVATAKTTGTVSLVLGASYAFSYIIAYEKIPSMVAAVLLNLSTNKYLLLLIVNGAFLVLGMFLDTMVIMVVFVPIVVPIAQALGINLVHFGVVVVLNVMIGLSTPPFGGLLFITSGISGTPLGRIIKDIIPMVFVMILVLLLITFIPDLVLFIPRLMLN
jgi:tripartite ATP-independent transporter DctM subunit